MVAIKVTATVDTTRARRRISRIRQELKQEANDTTKSLGERGKAFARKTAPYFSGYLVRNIVLRTTDGGNTATIVSQNPRSNVGAGFNLVMWMHHNNGILPGYKAVRGRDGKFYMKKSPGSVFKITSGNPQYMYATAEWLRRIAPETYRQRTDKVITKNK